MKIATLIIVVVLLAATATYSQNLHNSFNAASIENETDATTGWTGTAAISSDNTTSQNGLLSLRFAVQGTGREGRYTFNAQPGAVYLISIWARRSVSSNNPAFANWLGMTGFATTIINNQNWTQYNFTVTATITNPTIRVYAGPIGAVSGSDVFIDAVIIMPQTPPDSEAPTAPSGLTVSNITQSSALITWNASTDNIAVTTYTIKQNNNIVGTTNSTTLQYGAQNLTPATAYSYTITASDAANNISATSDTLHFNTLSPPVDTISPSTPTGLVATNISQTGFTLSWIASTDNFAVTGYLIYQDSLPAILTGNSSTSYIFTNLQPHTSYQLRVAATDEAGFISALSDTLVVTTSESGQVISWNSENSNLPTVNWSANNLYSAGVVGIGTQPNSNYPLSVNGTIRSKEIIVESGWSDFVFEPGYYLAPLEEVEDFILKNKHLKDIPSESEVRQNGVGLAEMNTLLLQKIEEITLYLIEANKRLIELEHLTKKENLSY